MIKTDEFGTRWARLFASIDEEYIRLIANRVAMYSDHSSHVTEKKVSWMGGSGMQYTIWIELKDGEYSRQDAEVAIGILEKDKRTSGPDWSKYYSQERQRNEVYY